MHPSLVEQQRHRGPVIVAFPRGRRRDGGLLSTEVVVPDNPLRWTSTYGSPVTAVYLTIEDAVGDSAILEFAGR